MYNNEIENIAKGLETLANTLTLITAQYDFQKIADAIADTFKPFLNITIPKIEWPEEFENKLRAFAEEAKASEGLSEAEFEAKYSPEVKMSRELGKSGWAISQFTTADEKHEWYKLLKDGKGDQIIKVFEDREFPILPQIVDHLGEIYQEERDKRYYSKAMQYFKAEDYMTAAMYLVVLVEYRVTRNIEFPQNAKRYKDKFSGHGFKDHLVNEYKAVPGFMTKIVLFLDIYPSLIAFLNRLFVDKDDAFKKDQELPYVNRNWLLHGRCNRDIERYECIQLLNALSVFEFTIDMDKE